MDMKKEAGLIKTLVELADKRLVSSMHDVSDGGLAVCLAECLFGGTVDSAPGFDVCVDIDLRHDVALFSESQSRAVISCPSENTNEVLRTARFHGVPAIETGRVTNGDVRLSLNGAVVIETSGPELMKPWSETLPAIMFGKKS